MKNISNNKTEKGRPRRLPATFAPDVSFDLAPASEAPFRAVQENRFEELKNQLLDARFETAFNSGFLVDLRRAANEAAALAWVTSYPLLVFPQLFEEKVQAALARAGRQKMVTRRSRELLPA